MAKTPLLKDERTLYELYLAEKQEECLRTSDINSTSLQAAFAFVRWENKTASSPKYRCKLIKQLVIESIQRSLKFYESHLNELIDLHSVFGLMMLKAVDDVHGQRIQKQFPIQKWASQLCSKNSFGQKEFCTRVANLWKSSRSNWKPFEVVYKLAKQFENIGNEKEVFWGPVTVDCQEALLLRCDVPYVCERTLFDPVPRSQYHLTHQLLQRIFAERFECEAASSLLDEKINDQLCAKMYREADFVAKLNYPEILRDLFTEYVALCGFKRYPNFFREDWLLNIISWQSQSDYGCFIREKEPKATIVEPPIMRKPTPEELKDGVNPDEACLSHFTATSLSALAVGWGYFEERCG
ncbi:unnamed protein product [Orchesella dallaii]|uniref:Uncharacterized protein n=1 Tax=Orchesella dallaii TaxID=48710 RepID=A0ABP1Q755_9HEXA